MTKIKTIADSIMVLSWLALSGLGIALRDTALVIASTFIAVLFIGLLCGDIIKLDNQAPKYAITVGNGDYYNGKSGFTCFAKAKVYRSFRSAKRSALKIITEYPIDRMPIIVRFFER